MCKMQLKDIIKTDEEDGGYFTVLGKTHYVRDFVLQTKNYNPETKVQTKVFGVEDSSVCIVKVEVFDDPVVTEISVMY